MNLSVVQYRGTSLIRTPLPPPRPQWEPRHGPTVGSYEVAASYEQGAPVVFVACRELPSVGFTYLAGLDAIKRPSRA